MKQIIGYPRVSKRIQALLIDSIIVAVGAIGTLIVVSKLGAPGAYSAIMAGLVVFMLEPLLVSTTGGTLGHHVLGIRVANKNTAKNINIIAAIVRFVVKIVLGLFSIISIFITRQHQAIHDSLVGSIVILKNPQAMKPYEALEEREVEEHGYSYPSKVRRVIMIILYNLTLLIVLGVVSTLSLSGSCVMYNQCSGSENVIAYSLSILWIIGFVASIILCWKGFLLGCRRKLTDIA